MSLETQTPPKGGVHAEEERKRKNVVSMTENIVRVKRISLLTIPLPCGKQ